MSRLYVRLFADFFAHRKTIRLRAALGNDALWIVPRLWAYAAEHQPDGDFSKYSPEEIAGVLGYAGDASSMLQALLDAGFMDPSPLGIHDWQAHNGYHEIFAARAKKAAAARWAKNAPPTPPSKEIENEQAYPKHRQACLKHPLPQKGEGENPPPAGGDKSLSELFKEGLKQ